MNPEPTIERWECPKHGATSAVNSEACGLCYPGKVDRPAPVFRTFVAVDALLADEAVHAAIASLIGQDVTDTIVYDEMRSVLSAAVDGVTGNRAS